jgi:hypothetical protein
MKKFLLGFLLVFFLVPLVEAAQPARVDRDEVDVYASPDSMSRVIETLYRGVGLAVSNLPTQGFYRVRTPSQKLGWIRASDLSFPRKGGGEFDLGSDSSEKRTDSSSKKASSFYVQGGLLGGADFLLGHDALSLTKGLGISRAYSLGGDITFFFNRWIGVGFKGAYYFRSRKVPEQDTGLVYDISISSIPLMLGLRSEVVKNTHFALSLGIYGGLGLSSVLQLASDEEGAAPTVYKAMPLAGLGAVGLSFYPIRNLRLFMEGGYQYLSTNNQLSPSEEGDSIDVFRNDEGELTTRRLSLSGMLISGGIGFEF